MSTTTTKHGLIKPELTDPADITMLNENWDKIDDKLSNILITSEVPSDAEMWIDPSEESIDESHITNMNNPHNVTNEQIGAAPSGFGLGESAGRTLHSLAELDSAFSNGWYDLSISEGVAIGGETIVVKYATVFVASRSNKYGYQIMHIQGQTTRLIRFNLGGTWGEWEYINPSIAVGREYRTTERYKGKPVYVKAVDFGALPNNSTSSISHGVSNVENVISCTGTLNNGTTLPYINAQCYATKGTVYIASTTNNASYTAVVTIKYTKTTD